MRRLHYLSWLSAGLYEETVFASDLELWWFVSVYYNLLSTRTLRNDLERFQILETLFFRFGTVYLPK